MTPSRFYDFFTLIDYSVFSFVKLLSNLGLIVLDVNIYVVQFMVYNNTNCTVYKYYPSINNFNQNYNDNGKY